MKVFVETDIATMRDKDEFWGGAEDFAANLTDAECDALTSTLEELYPDGIDRTQLNDILRFDREWVNEVIGREDGDGDED